MVSPLWQFVIVATRYQVVVVMCMRGSVDRSCADHPRLTSLLVARKVRRVLDLSGAVVRRLLTGVCTGVLLAVMMPGVGSADQTRDDQWYLDALDVAAAQEITKGAGVRIGMVDSGVDPEHPDLAGLMVGHGHGPDGSEGILGIAPEATVISASVYPPDHDQESLESDVATEQAIVQSIRWLADQDVDVMLLAYSGPGSAEQRDAVAYAADKGITIITGTGNLSDDPFAFSSISDPARFEQTTAIAGTNQEGEHWERSKVGREAMLAAPAENVLSTVPGGGYEYSSGTSNSAAIVAGVAALMKAQWPDMPWDVIQWRITETANDIGADGVDDETGFGMVDPVAALTGSVDVPEGSTDEEINPEPYPRTESEGDTNADGTTSVLSGDGGGPSVWWPVGGGLVVVAFLTVTVLIVEWSRRRNRAAVESTLPNDPARLLLNGYVVRVSERLLDALSRWWRYWKRQRPVDTDVPPAVIWSVSVGDRIL